MADLDVGQRGGRRLPGLATSVEPRPSRAGTGGFLRTGRLFTVGLTPEDHFVAGDQRSGRGADRVTSMVVFRAVPRGPAGIRLEHAPGAGNVRGRRRRSPGGGAPPDEPSRGRR